ncbi:glycosyltransferase family 9 protein [Mucilaginibacter sp. JRF]|uniref:glycosyltransferase family 9 protein n=1 Tax=Mucilaginibacter sp. JRF TaxID=2780088 RepID=UPI00187F0AA2|nr:glycosyltransferase family 9 protein [Mucilaginibacter sp. JRF]MBE9585936.1 glycosyltransferase family 9 protein [Mucilaginibacter sp. JRF]
MSWENCKNILCIRQDNMGDLLMSGPAIRALKETFKARITVLTSTMAAGIARSMPEIDDILIFDVPWVKSALESNSDCFEPIVELLKKRSFDAAVIFTVFSQSPLPTAMLTYLAGIKRVLAYCRENPYQLINYWVPDKEPYHYIKHQVDRDLELAATVGAFIKDKRLRLTVNDDLWPPIVQKLKQRFDFDDDSPWLMLHPGVSEKKREFPLASWTELGIALVAEGYKLIITGSESEKHLTDSIASAIGNGSVSAGGLFTLNEFICLSSHSPLLISVNTGTIHIASATQTPVVVLYAQTNPQHTPWQVPHSVLYYSIPEDLRSKNQVVSFLNKTLYKRHVSLPSTYDILIAVNDLKNK